jgi:RNA polymerase sigma-70 factor (ECF subfamily)
MDFDTFYAASYDRVRRAMTLTFRDPELAEEIAQEAFFQTLRRWKKVSLLDHPEGWTMVVALNKGRDLHRRRVRQEAKQLLLVRPSANSSGEALVDARLRVTELLEGLSDRQREALLLRYITQLTIPEIAKVMGCAEGTVKATLHAARAKASLQAKDTYDVID